MCLLAALYFFGQRHDAGIVVRANHLAARGELTQALGLTRHRLRAPSDERALVVRAYALEALGRLGPASAAFARVARRDPNNWAVHRDWGLTLALLGHRAQASRELGRARALNPRMPLPFGFIPAR